MSSTNFDFSSQQLPSQQISAENPSKINKTKRRARSQHITKAFNELGELAKPEVITSIKKSRRASVLPESLKKKESKELSALINSKGKVLSPYEQLKKFLATKPTEEEIAKFFKSEEQKVHSQYFQRIYTAYSALKNGSQELKLSYLGALQIAAFAENEFVLGHKEAKAYRKSETGFERSFVLNHTTRQISITKKKTSGEKILIGQGGIKKIFDMCSFTYIQKCAESLCVHKEDSVQVVPKDEKQLTEKTKEYMRRFNNVRGLMGGHSYVQYVGKNGESKEKFVQAQAVGDLIELSEFELSEKQLALIFTDIANGICYLHNEEKVVHLDIKLGNILTVRADDQQFGALISDFDFSFEPIKGEKPEYYSHASLAYSPPECLREGAALFEGKTDEECLQNGRRIDMYGIGIMMLEMMGEFAPWREDAARAIVIRDRDGINDENRAEFEECKQRALEAQEDVEAIIGELREKVMDKDHTFYDKYWLLAYELLHPNVELRLTASEFQRRISELVVS